MWLLFSFPERKVGSNLSDTGLTVIVCCALHSEGILRCEDMKALQFERRNKLHFSYSEPQTVNLPLGVTVIRSFRWEYTKTILSSHGKIPLCGMHESNVRVNFVNEVLVSGWSCVRFVKLWCGSEKDCFFLFWRICALKPKWVFAWS